VSFLLAARLAKFFEELVVSPLPNWIVMAGYVIGGMIRGLFVMAFSALLDSAD
jgi:ABC-2 type transport system permease protein